MIVSDAVMVDTGYQAFVKTRRTSQLKKQTLVYAIKKVIQKVRMQGDERYELYYKCTEQRQ